MNEEERLRKSFSKDVDDLIRRKNNQIAALKADKELERYFEDTFLKGTCFASLKELREDKTLIQINAPRALIAVELMGKWSGFNAGIKKSEKQIATLKAEIEELNKIITDALGHNHIIEINALKAENDGLNSLVTDLGESNSEAGEKLNQADAKLATIRSKVEALKYKKKKGENEAQFLVRTAGEIDPDYKRGDPSIIEWTHYIKFKNIVLDEVLKIIDEPAEVHSHTVREQPKTKKAIKECGNDLKGGVE